MSYGLHAGSDRLKSSQSEQVEGCRAQRRHRSGAVAPVAMGVLVQLGVTDPVPALNAPAIPHQLQQGFWGGAQAGEEEMGLPEGLAVAGSGGNHLYDPAGVPPGPTDVLRCLFGAEHPGSGIPVFVTLLGILTTTTIAHGVDQDRHCIWLPLKGESLALDHSISRMISIEEDPTDLTLDDGI